MSIEFTGNPVYVFGHTPPELQRLIDQSAFFGALTEQVFRAAGLAPGMRVLDVGCGPGDVSFLAASFVGPTGSIVGVDSSADALHLARERAARAALTNVTFMEGDVAELALDGTYDAVVGRLILMYLKKPVQAVRRFASLVRPGGLIVLHEMDTLGARSVPVVPLFEQCAGWITETCRRGGVDVQMGMKLYSTFVRAGLTPPQMLLGGRVEGGGDTPGFKYVADTLRSVLPMAERFGVLREGQVDLDTLPERLRAQTAALDAVIAVPPLVGAWTRV